MAQAPSFSGWLSQIPLRRTGRRTLILSISSIFALWFLFLFSPPVSNIKISLPDVPAIKIDLHPGRPPPRGFNDSKVALLIEDRPIAHLAPLLLHMISVVPPDWRFVFLGSASSIAFANRSLPIQTQARSGKLDLRELPAEFPVDGQKPLSRTLTSLPFWRWLGGKDTWDWENPYTTTATEELDGDGPDGTKRRRRRPQVEWVLVFQTDSILCANSRVSLNEWLHYDWVGAPWHMKDPFGGNGGLSLRRISRIMQVLNFQNRHPNTLEMEDFWLVQRIGLLPGARMANTTAESHFSVEQVWFGEPMGYHMGWSGARLPGDVWDDPRHREQIWKWCPEIKLILDMKLERECRGDFLDTVGGVQGYDDYGGGNLRWGDDAKRKRAMEEGKAEWSGLSAW